MTTNPGERAPAIEARNLVKTYLSTNADSGIVFTHLGYLVIFALVCAWLATQAFRSYQRSA